MIMWEKILRPLVGCSKISGHLRQNIHQNDGFKMSILTSLVAEACRVLTEEL